MSALAAMAGQAGLPIVRQILSGSLGDQSGQLATQVIGQIAAKAQVAPEGLEDLAATQPGVVIDAMRATEKESPNVLGLYAADLQWQMAALAAEQDEPLWMRAWRPAGMYLIGIIWLWTIVLLPLANAVFGAALVPVEIGTLMQLSGLYMGLYMGGHTVKDIVSKMVSK